MQPDSTTDPLVHIDTFGCQMNVYDSTAIYGLLTAAGFRRADSPTEADILLLNTCSVREHAEHRIISRVGELSRCRSEGQGPAVIGICGCMAERLGEKLLKLSEGVDLVVGVDRYQQLPGMLREILARRIHSSPVAVGHQDDVHYLAPPELLPTNNSHLVTIHKGCDYRCTYCIVPATRGPQREKAPEVILEEIQSVIAAGGTEVTLLGQNVTAYCWRNELDFAGLLQRIAKLDGLRRIRFLTGHPRDVTDRLLTVMATVAKVCPALHVPMQSGSDRILKRMKRLYRRQEYLEMVERAREMIPRLTFSSDFIVGFPGETDDDFNATLEVIRQVAYDQVFAFKYSVRPDTPAARLPDDVPLAAKKRRLAKLLGLQAEVWHSIAAAQVGQVWQVAVEAPARRPAGVWKARTANNRKVLVPLPKPRPGQELSVRITGYQNTTFRGEPLNTAR